MSFLYLVISVVCVYVCMCIPTAVVKNNNKVIKRSIRKLATSHLKTGVESTPETSCISSTPQTTDNGQCSISRMNVSEYTATFVAMTTIIGNTMIFFCCEKEDYSKVVSHLKYFSIHKTQSEI
jgi:hypothetical protein